MKVQTSWLKPPPSITGLDQLGTQAPCILIYGQLLPGITNVTDRARYYSFYPWVVWSFDQRYPKQKLEQFIEFFRRADCLFTLIAERHARQTDSDNERHGVAMVGRVRLLPALTNLEHGGMLRLSDYTVQDPEQRYFKNKWGGLKQYYFGTLSGLGLMDASESDWLKYTKEHGAPLAESFDTAVPSDLFWKTIENDSVTVSALDNLEQFCPCFLEQSKAECSALTQIYFDEAGKYEEEGIQRRRSLGLIQDLVTALPSGNDLSQELFRACVYTANLPGGKQWRIPAPIEETRRNWATYVRNDMLSLACQTVLALSLRELQPQVQAAQRRYQTVEAFAREFSVGGDASKVLGTNRTKPFGVWMDAVATKSPERGKWEDDGHELQLAANLLSGWESSEPTDGLLERILKVLALLANRDDLDALPYGALAITPEALADYPINLVSFRQKVNIWRSMPMREMLCDLFEWCLTTHLRVALRKLRQTGHATFQLRPTELGLEAASVEIPPPAETTPRFRQAVQILRDIGVLKRDLATQNRQTKVTSRGKKLMEFACG